MEEALYRIICGRVKSREFLCAHTWNNIFCSLRYQMCQKFHEPKKGKNQIARLFLSYRLSYGAKWAGPSHSEKYFA